MNSKILAVGILVMILVSVNLSSIAMNNEKTIDITSDDNNLLYKHGLNTNYCSKNWTEQYKLLASDGEIYDEFGGEVAIDSDYVIIGARKDNDNGHNAGSAYIFKRDGENWTEVIKLLASDGEEGDSFGCSVSISGDYAIIGAYLDDDNGNYAGSAYIFKKDGENWTEIVKLIPEDNEAGDKFGYSVSIDEDYAIIGAPEDNDFGTESGSVYIFKRVSTTWEEVIKLQASDSLSHARFGFSVSIKEDYAIIGAPDRNCSAYIFKRNCENWTEVVKIQPEGNASFDLFGYSVSIDRDYAIIGALFDDEGGQNAGSAYIFKYDGISWVEEAKLMASDCEEEDVFGHSVSISGNCVIVGSPGDNFNGQWSGSAYIYKRNGTTWLEEKIIPSDGSAGDCFGDFVSINNNYVVIGAPDDDDNGDRAGSAYIFTTSSENLPPETPSIDGEIEGNYGEPYDYTFITTDPDGDDVFYYIEWGDETNSGWIGPYDSGQEIVISHTWDEEDTYTIRAMAKDIFDAESDWGTLEVTMPVSQQSFSFPLLQRLFERFPNAFPILRNLLEL